MACRAIQAVGAMFTMPVASKLTDKVGSGHAVLVDFVLMGCGVLGLGQVGAFTPIW
jgi:hypothetical protein